MDPSACLELLSGHDILTPESDPSLVRQFLGTLVTHRVISRGSPKDLQPLLASINVCLNGNQAQGKLNGLLALDVLIQECQSNLFLQAGASWLQQLQQVIKTTNATAIFFPKACQVLSRLIGFAPDFPDVSRNFTSVAANLVTTLIDCAKANPTNAKIVVKCIQSLQKSYFGACGPAIKHIEKFLVENIHPSDGIIDRVALADSFALLPRAGGGGKEGVVHREAWDQLNQKLVYTLEHIFENIFSLLPSIKKNWHPTETEAKSLNLLQPRDSLDILRKAFFYGSQFAMVADCLYRLLVSPFPHQKSIRPSLFFKVAHKILSTLSLTSLAKNVHDHEAKVLISVLPEVMVSLLKVIDGLVKTCREDLLLFVPDLLNLTSMLIGDLRQCADNNGATIPFDPIRLQLYRLVETMCATLGSNSGLEFLAGALVPLLVSDFIPPKTGVKLSAVSSHKKHKKQSSANENPELKGLPLKVSSHPDLVASSLSTLGSVFRTCGNFIKKSIHKNVQCVLIGLCLDIQLQTGSKSGVVGFASPTTRATLYSVLLDVAVHHHPRWPFPIQYAVNIFQRGSSLCHESSLTVRHVCKVALDTCQTIIQPRSSSLELDLPLDPEEILATKNEAMKIHLVYIDSGLGSGSQQGLSEANGSSELIDGDDASDDEIVTNGDSQVDPERKQIENNFSNEPGFDLLSGKTGGAKKSVDIREEVVEEMDLAECEQLMKDVNSFENKTSITIPEEVANRTIESKNVTEVGAKKRKLEDDGDDEGPDLETMLASFVDKPK